MARNITFDTSKFDEGMKRLEGKFGKVHPDAIKDVATEILRLSQFEVPHDKGLLQNSGHIEPDGKDGQIVGYNKVYAARLHENPQFNFQKGRKGKYLEDPIKKNISVFLKHFKNSLSRAFT